MMSHKQLQHFQKHIELDLLTGCWLWKGALRNGYGLFFLNGKTETAHRLSFVYWNGAIQKGLEIDHLCRTKNCVNPSHLEAVTRLKHTHRGFSFSALNAKKTHCDRGHKLIEPNMKIYFYNNTPRRYCLICINLRNAEYSRRKNVVNC